MKRNINIKINNKVLLSIIVICSVLILIVKVVINRLTLNSFNNTIIIEEYSIGDVGSSNNDGSPYYNNLNFKFSLADPTIVKHNGCLYTFGTDHSAYKSCDSKTWLKHTYKINGNLPKYDYFWAPEVHKIENYYYMIFTLVTWGSGFPWTLDSFGSVYYARSSDLQNFTFLGELPYGSSYFDGKVDNKNHIDGSLLIDGNNYYHYYKLDTMDKTVPSNDVQELYGIKLKLNSNGTFSEDGKPKLIIRRNKEANPADSSNITWNASKIDNESIDEGPFVIKKNGKYYLTFSTGNYTNDTYRVIVATSNNPLGPFFRDKTGNKIRYFLTGQNYTNNNKTDVSRNSSKYIYGTGHGSILTLSFNDSLIGDYKEYYYAYHSNIYENGTFIYRKFNIDEMGFDKNGNAFVNGPTIDNQPLISGSTLNGVTYYKVPPAKYGSTVLSDGIKYSSKSIKASVVTTKELSFSFKNNERLDLTDVWVYGTGNNLGTVSGTMYINGNSITKNFSITSSGSSLKIELPSVNEKIKNLKIIFNKSLTLSEVELVRNSNNNYYLVSFNGNGGIVPKSNILVIHNSKIYSNIANIPTRNGYRFLGWYTSETGGTLVYKSDGNYNTNATNFWSLIGNWVHKNDITLYAHWEKSNITSNSSSSSSQNNINGDVNGDGIVNSVDYILIKKHILKTSSLSGNNLKIADVNKDNKITSVDYVAIKKIIINS